MRHIKRRNLNKEKSLIFLGMFSLLFVLSVGYAAFQTNISLNVIGNITSPKDLYVSAYGSDINGNGTINNPYETIQKAYDESPRQGIINVITDLNVSSTINLDKDKKISIISYSTNNTIHTIKKSALINTYLIRQTSGSVTLKNITIDGDNISDTHGCFRIDSSKIFIGEEATLKNFYVTYSSGGAISATNGAEITIDGGTISDNTITRDLSNGAGIFINGSVLNIENGTIENNQNVNGQGGGIFSIDSTINMKNGLIKNNYAKRYGGGIGLQRTIMDMTGGIIIQNSSDGRGGAISLDRNETIFSLNGGTIKNNSAAELSGGIFKLSGSSPTYNYISGIVCENTPVNAYETSSTCPS